MMRCRFKPVQVGITCLGFAVFAAACGGSSPASEQPTVSQLALDQKGACTTDCVKGKHHDPKTCECVLDHPACTTLCTVGRHHDPTTCECVPDQHACNTMCIIGTHHDPATCACVPDVKPCTLDCAIGFHRDSARCACVQDELVDAGEDASGECSGM